MYVSDTHPLIHHAGNRPSRLSSTARRIFDRADAGELLIYVPSVALWEVAALMNKGKVLLPQPFDHWCRGLQGSRGFEILALDWPDVDEARRLPFRDPFDCLITGTALRLNLPLITRDQQIVNSRLIETIW